MTPADWDREPTSDAERARWRVDGKCWCVAREALVPVVCLVDHQLYPGKECEFGYRIRTDEHGQAT